MKTDICPVCNGTGEVPVGFYQNGIQGGGCTGMQSCRSCAGMGYVYVPEEDEYACLDCWVYTEEMNEKSKMQG